MPDRQSNRLTDNDRAVIRARIKEVLRNWDDPTTEEVAREGYHAIGCNVHDLRDSELEEIDGMVTAALASATEPR